MEHTNSIRIWSIGYLPGNKTAARRAMGVPMPTYLVGFSDSESQEQDFKMIDASSENEAIDKFIQAFAIADDIFVEYVYSRSVNMSFAEHFWLQTEGEDTLFNKTGQIVIDDEEFKKRVRAFFSRHRDYAERYIAYYFDAEDSPKTRHFPEEMLIYMWVNSDFSGVTAVELDDSEED
jgi:hypothetical protein